jgi:hypothetical protein
MCKNLRLLGLLLLVLSGFVVASCTKGTEQFIVSSDEEGVICSAKSSFNDTLFYENRFPDTTIYYYALLSKQENQKLKELILNLKQEKSLPKFELRPGSGTFIVESGEVKFYEGNYALPSRNTKNILSLFQKKASSMKLCKKVNDFWNVEGVTPPENPIP